MNEKDYNGDNVYKFSLYQQNVMLCEKIFDANQFSPSTRYFINIIPIMKQAITKLQICLSEKSFETNLEKYGVVDSGNQVYDLFQYQKDMINTFPQEIRNNLSYNPQSTTQSIQKESGEKTIKGIECEIRFYINDKPIVKRTFYVNGFNPVSRWSLDMKEAVVDIADAIFDQIKKTDLKNIWDDYDLINKRGMTINQIRELSLPKREEMLRQMKYN